MAGDEESENLFFGSQALMFIPIRSVRQPIVVIVNFFFSEDAEQSMLTGFCVPLSFLRALDGLVEHRRKLGAAAKRVHGAALNKRFEHTLVEQPQINSLAKIEDRLKFCRAFSGRSNRFNCATANILYCVQAKANRAAVRREI